MARMEPISEVLRAVVGDPDVEVKDPRYAHREPGKRPTARPGKSPKSKGKRATSIDYSDPKAVARARARDAKMALLARGIDGLAVKW